MDEEMHGEKWFSLKSCAIICHKALKVVSGNRLLRMQVKRGLSENTSYKK